MPCVEEERRVVQPLVSHFQIKDCICYEKCEQKAFVAKEKVVDSGNVSH